jgi:hypothetical protein
MGRRPTKADADFLGVVGSRLDLKKAGKGINAGVPKPGERDYPVKLAAANHGTDLAILKANEMLGDESKIRETQRRAGDSRSNLRAMIEERRTGALAGSRDYRDSGPIARVARSLVGLNPSRLEAVATRHVRAAYSGAAGFIEAAGRAGSQDAVTLGSLRPEQFNKVVKARAADAKLAKKQALKGNYPIV